jgi:hypothetical protein
MARSLGKDQETVNRTNPLEMAGYRLVTTGYRLAATGYPLEIPWVSRQSHHR